MPGGIGPLELLIVLAFVVGPAVAIGFVARERGRSAIGWGALSVVAWPVSLILVLVLPDRSRPSAPPRSTDAG